MMKFSSFLLVACIGASLFCSFSSAQQPATSTSSTVVPHLVSFSGRAIDTQGTIITGIAGATFAIYQDQYEGAPLWLETQNVTADTKGNYTTQLGATKPDGLPLGLFTTGEARWLGVRINGGEEQPRVLLLSVPYALKAADAQTLGGLPASAFVLAAPTAAAGRATTVVSSTASVTPTVSGTGSTDYVPLWTNSTGALGNSVLFQSGTGSAVKVGINTTVPAVTLDVNGAENVHGTLNMMATGAATGAAGKSSQPLDFTASAFSSSTATAVSQRFQWQAEPVGNNTATPGGAFSLLYGSGTAAPAETGLKIAKNGIITFASGQTFPGSGGGGTVTSVGLTAPTSDFTVTGSPVKTSGTLNIAWNVAPTSSATANAIVKRDSNGGFQAGEIIGSLGVSGYVGSGTGVYGQSNGSASGSNGVEGITYAGPGSGVAGFNYGTSGGIGVYGNGGNGSAATGVYGTGTIGIWGTGLSYGFATDSNVQQARTAGGWVKALVLLDQKGILRCFNSTLSGAAATTPPCNFFFHEWGTGDYTIDFQFQVNDRFVSATAGGANGITPGGPVVTACVQGLGDGSCNNTITATQVEVANFCANTNTICGGFYVDNEIYLIIY
jgi:hypothetical protein